MLEKIKGKDSSFGFTLLEIMVAMLLTGIIFSILFGVYAQTLDVAESVEQGQGAMRMLRLGTERIRVDLLGVVSPPLAENGTNATGEEEPEPSALILRDIEETDSEDPVFLEFCTLNMLEFSDRFPHGEAVRVAYLLRDGTLIRRQSPFPGLEGEWPSLEVELAGEVRELGVACIGPEGESFSFWPPEGDGVPPVPELLVFSFIQGREGEQARQNMFTVRPKWWGEQGDREYEAAE